MKRGDVVLTAIAGDYGKPRPAVIIQSNFYIPTHDSILVAIMTSTITVSPQIRVTVTPSPTNGLRKTSQIMVDKIFAQLRTRLSEPIGHLDQETLMQLNQALLLFQGLA